MTLKDPFQFKLYYSSVTLCSLLWFKPGSGTRQGCQLWQTQKPLVMFAPLEGDAEEAEPCTAHTTSLPQPSQPSPCTQQALLGSGDARPALSFLSC